MPKILDDQLFDTLQEYEQIKSDRLKLEKVEKSLRVELDKKLGDYDEDVVEVGELAYMENEDTPLYIVRYTSTERRSISREKLIERGVSLEVLLYATDVTQSRRFSFKRSD